MKKLLLLLSLAMSIFFISCKKEEIKNETIHLEKYKIETSDLKSIAEYHSKGLDYIYDKLSSKSTTKSLNIKGCNSEILKRRIRDLSIEFIQSVTNTNAKIRSLTETDNNNQELSYDAQHILDDYFSYLMNSKNREDVEAYIQKITKTEGFNTLDEKEQKLLVFMMYIGIDSASYWSNLNNWNKWDYLKNDKVYTEPRGIAGPPASYWMTSEQMNDPNFQKCIKNDVYGCLTSLVTGFNPWSWCSGGILGSVGAFLL